MSDAEVSRLPEPELFRDALFLAGHPGWTPQALDATDTRLLRLIKSLSTPRKGS